MDRRGRATNTRGYLGINKPRLFSRSDQSDWRRPSESDGKENDQQPNSGLQFSGEFVRIDPDAKFLEYEQVEGVHLVTNFDLVRQLQIRIGELAKGPTDFFPACWPVTLSNENINFLASEPYDVIPRAHGTRYLLYVDSAGHIYLENMTQHIFRVDDDHAINMVSTNGRPITDTVLDGVFTGGKRNSRGNSDEGGDEIENTGKLTFLINDAIRCNGVDLTDLNIRSRLNIVQDEIMKTWNKRTIVNETEAFNLDIVDCIEAQSALDYLSYEFQNDFKYSFRCLVFFPRQKGYKCNTCYDVFQWSEASDYTCNFRLKFSKFSQYKETNKAELHAVGYPQRNESFFDTITVTEEMCGLDGHIIECRYVDRQWVFVRQRNDRDHPNGRNAIYNKLKVMKNPITRQRLVAALQEFK